MRVWVCAACGKWWRGNRDDARDVSCFLHAVECKENERTIGQERGMERDGWEALR